jgi:anthranilate synthase component 1
MSQTDVCPNLIPVVRELPADLETPVSIYLRLAGQRPSFMLESVTGGEHVARYSFIGVNPSQAFVLRGRTAARHTPAGVTHEVAAPGANPLASLRAELNRQTPQIVPGLPRFVGGLVGYLGYETMRFFEPVLKLAPHADLPDAIFLQADTLVAFDHAYGRLLLIANAHLNGDEAAARAEAEARLDELERRLAAPLPAASRPPRPQGEAVPLRSNLTPEEYMANVVRAKEYIAAGDIFQVVLSQRFSRETTAEAFDIYRALRRLNPSPYMFFFDFAELAGPAPLRLIGASPEVHVRLEGRQALLRPIAGTRPRSHEPAADQALARELLADPKERAEHVMLVDLARNDLGRVCEYGSVQTPELMTIERYSHVMHIVSQVEGCLQGQYDGLDLVQATFPAGTVSGAPKIRAMEIISELEPDPRGVYAGAVGYFSYDGSLDTCIAIRTLVMQGQTVSVQAGAGIVADSIPENEYQETVNKARALVRAVERAESEK